MAIPSFRVTALRRHEQHPNLLAAWGFDEGSGSITQDSSGKGKTLTVGTGISWVAGHTGGTALQNTGADNTGGANGLWTMAGNAITIMGWARPLDLTAGSNRPLFGIWDAPSIANFTFVAIWAQRGNYGTPNVLQGNVRVANSLVPIAGTALSVGAWVHVALSYDGTTIRLYRDGNNVANVSSAGNMYTGASVFCVVPNPAAAQVDDVRVFNAALTVGDIKAFMNDPVVPL